ncbi:MAG: M4 family metallopeptidase [Methylococcaceae bacterium]|nr:M4 family metallopeptidase [Methylococcaceae bacterium]
MPKLKSPFFYNTLTASILLAFSSASPALPVNSQASQAIEALKASSASSVKLTYSDKSGLVNFLSTDQTHPITLLSPPGSSADQRATEFMSSYGKAFGISSIKNLKTTKKSAKDEVGMEHVRMQQMHNGIPITAGELTLHMKGNNVTSVNAKTLVGIDNLNTIPKITASDAIKTAGQLLKKLGIENANYSKPRLEILNKSLLRPGDDATHLAWFIEAKKIDVRQNIWIDAEGGSVLMNFSQLPDALNRKVFTAASTAALPGTLVRSEGQAATADADVNAAYTFAGHTYAYFSSHHGRDSYNGLGAPLISTVHYCPDAFNCPFANAFWNGEQMVYGDGFAAADDVDAHELTHAVTEYSANLFYYAQSGALNESFSDIFGETVDLGNAAGTDTAAVRWLMGENVPGIGAIRNMKNPTAFGDPNRVKDVNFKCDVNDGDQGGVHSNSGVPNHAYQLMVDGGTFNGQTIVGIGLTKAEKIEYRALTQYLTSGSNFVDDYNALQRSCTDLIGTAGITAANCAEVKKAITAVQMNLTVCAKPNTPALCPVGKTVKTLFFDGFEASGSNFATNDFNVWSIIQGNAKTGALSAFGRTLSTVSDTHYKMTKNVLLPVNSKMQFDHTFDFEIFSGQPVDGGVVEYSTDNGITWLDSGSLMAGGILYNGVISNISNNPLVGKSAFIADSFGYRSTQINLASLSGKNIRFRFRMGSDESTAFLGWFIDNMRIYQCI